MMGEVYRPSGSGTYSGNGEIYSGNGSHRSGTYSGNYWNGSAELHALAFSFFVFVGLALGACTAENGAGGDRGPLAPGGSGGGVAGASGAVAGVGAGGAWLPDPYAGSSGGGTEGTLDSGVTDACASISREAEQVEVEKEVEVLVEVVEADPVALYFMLDESGSMMESPLYIPPFKWNVAVDAIKWFVNDPGSANIDVALQYFPIAAGDCLTGAGYDTPAVPMGTLPGHATAITTALDTHFPGASGGGGTPIEGALRGVTQFCAAFKTDPVANPQGEECVAVLITDGQPTQCNVFHDDLVKIAADAYANHQVMTFAIGMAGADFTLLDRIGEAGHGDCTPDPADPTWACNVSTGGTTFVDALNQIRNMVTTMVTRYDTVTELQTVALECEWEIPAPPAEEAFNRDKVNVEFTPTGLDADKQMFGRVDSAAACRDNLGWYYDDPNAPTRIIACEKTCETIQATETGKINILLGCGTLIIE